MIPQRSIILLAGVPATGKSTFGQYLAHMHGFAHYDLERDPLGWPCPELKELWDSSRPAFVTALKGVHKRVALNWGFPVHCLSWVHELQGAGVQIVWFTGSLDRARELFLARGENDVAQFDAQVKEIKNAGLPGAFQWTSVSVISETGTFLTWPEVERLVFVQNDDG